MQFDVGHQSITPSTHQEPPIKDTWYTPAWDTSTSQVLACHARSVHLSAEVLQGP